MYRLCLDVSTGFCGLHYVRLLASWQPYKPPKYHHSARLAIA
jgi:hypothetical protein